MKRSPQMLGWKFAVRRTTSDLPFWDGAPETWIDIFFLSSRTSLSFEWYGMMGFVLCELLKRDVECLQGHGIYKQRRER